MQHRFSWKHSVTILLCFVLLFALRNAILFLLLPAITCFYFSAKTKRYQFFVFAGFYSAAILLFFVLPHFSQTLNFPQYIINKQAEFNALQGNSKVSLPLLQPTIFSFSRFFPYALDLIFLRPHWSDVKSFPSMLSFLENGFVIILLLFWLFFHRPLQTIHPLLICFLFFSFSVWLLCGYTVPFSGAVARYKSLVLPLFFLFFILTINFEKFFLKKLRK